MKKFTTHFAALLSILLVFSFAACGGASSSAVSDPNEVKYVAGEITGTADGMITVKTDDGRELSFATGEADVSKAPDLAAGQTVEIYYKGTVNGSDATGVTVVRLVQDNSASAADAEKFVTGNILESDGATLVIQPDDGSAALTFNIVAADATGADGLVVGDDVTVYYTGAIDKDDTSGVTVTRLSQDASQVRSHAAAALADPPEPTTTGHTSHAVSGTITYCDGATLTMNTTANLPLSFMISGADATGANGLAEGSQVTVYYTGDLRGTDTSGVTVTKLEQDAPPPPAPAPTDNNPSGDNSVYGLITYSDGATLTIQTGSGQSLNFLVAGADATDANGLADGSYVTIYYTGNVNGDDISGVTVMKLVQ